MSLLSTYLNKSHGSEKGLEVKVNFISPSTIVNKKAVEAKIFIEDKAVVMYLEGSKRILDNGLGLYIPVSQISESSAPNSTTVSLTVSTSLEPFVGSVIIYKKLEIEIILPKNRSSAAFLDDIEALNHSLVYAQPSAPSLL